MDKVSSSKERRRYFFEFGGIETFFNGQTLAEALRILVHDPLWKGRLPNITAVKVETVQQVVVKEEL